MRPTHRIVPALLALLAAPAALPCVQPPPEKPRLCIRFLDPTTCEVRARGYTTFGAATPTFCACGVTWVDAGTGLILSLDDFAIVLEDTNTPAPGFGSWQGIMTTSAVTLCPGDTVPIRGSTSTGSCTAITSSFVASASGVVTGQPVELRLRFTVAPGTTVCDLRDAFRGQPIETGESDDQGAYVNPDPGPGLHHDLVYAGDICGSQEYGFGCAGSGGFVPSLGVDGCPCPSDSASLEIANGLGGAPALLFVGLQPAALPVFPDFGCTLWVDPAEPIPAIILPIPLGGVGPGSGEVSLPFAITGLPAGVFSLELYLQSFIVDPGAPRGASDTNGLKLLVDIGRC